MKCLKRTMGTWFYNVVLFCVLYIIFCTNHIGAATTESPDVTTEASNERNVKIPKDPVIPKVVVTVACVVAFVLLCISISKLVDYYYDRHAISDDASDISEHTKELLKAQLMLAFSKTSKNKKDKLTPDELLQKYSNIWRAKVKRNRARNMKRDKEERSGSVRPTSARIKSASRTKARVTTVNEKAKPPPASKVSPAKGLSRPISAGLKSKPTSARSFKFVPRAGKRS